MDLDPAISTLAFLSFDLLILCSFAPKIISKSLALSEFEVSHQHSANQHISTLAH